MAGYVNGSTAVSYQMPALSPRQGSPYGDLSVVKGDGRSRRQGGELSPIAVTAVRCAAVFAVVLVVAAFARILLIAMAFGVSSQNATLESQLDEQRALGSQLEVQESVYGRPERILDLAVNVYGMVPSQGESYLDLSSSESAWTTAGTADEAL